MMVFRFVYAKLSRILFAAAMLVVFFGQTITVAIAQTASPVPSYDVNQKTQLSDPKFAYAQLGNLFSLIFTLILIAGGITAIAFFIVGAIQYGTAGDGNGAAKARQTMTSAVIGLILLSLVYVFLHFYTILLPSGTSS